MIHTVTPAGRAVRWDGTNQVELEQVCGGATVRMHLFDEASIVVDAWGTPKCVSHGDWVVVARGAISVHGQRQFVRKYRITTTKKAAAA